MKKQGSYIKVNKVPSYIYYQSEDFTCVNEDGITEPVLVSIYENCVTFQQGEHEVDIDINLIEDFFKCLQKFRKENS